MFHKHFFLFNQGNIVCCFDTSIVQNCGGICKILSSASVVMGIFPQFEPTVDAIHFIHSYMYSTVYGATAESIHAHIYETGNSH